MANFARANPWKDFATLRSAVEANASESLLLVALGDTGDDERLGRSRIRFVPHQAADVVATYYQAADLYIHAAHVDTFPNTVIEAPASGTPVVATDVGGIGEQVRDGETGLLVRAGDAAGFADAIRALIGDADRRATMGLAAAADAARRFQLARHADDYLSWYEDILGSEIVPAVP